MKYVRVMDGDISNASGLQFKIGEVVESKDWNPNESNRDKTGGINFSNEENILRWIRRGDTLYDVELPDDAEIRKIDGTFTPNGLFRANKVIVRNPRKVTDEMALEFYKKSNIPEVSYYKTLGAVALMNYKNTALTILGDKVNKDNINIVLDEWNDFIGHGGDGKRKDSNDTVKLIDEYLNEINSDLSISVSVDKEPYIKKISDDKIINLTGESGAGKSTYSQKYENDDNYIIIDTDEVFSKNKNTVGINKELGLWFKNKYNRDLDTCADFPLIYKGILEYFKDSDKTIVIDSAQYRNLRTKEDLELLKGEVIVIRTCIDKCYERCIDRWKTRNNNYTIEELEKYKNRKHGMYLWYKSLNEFIENIDSINNN